MVTIKDVQAARKRLFGHAVETPLLSSHLLNDRLNARVFFKAENLQRTGSFKFRGAFNAVSALLDRGEIGPDRGIIACSSGNHAQGIAEAARLKGISATIIMPSDAPITKVERTKRSGAHVVFYDRSVEDREAVTHKHAEETGLALIHPYNEPLVIAGQGTCALEAMEQMGDETPDTVLVCTGGGGLSAGVALAVQHHAPGAAFHTVEPVGFDDYARSLVAGERVENARTSGSICDAIITPQPGEHSFSILNGYASDGLIVSDEEALHAVAFAFHELKTVVEPGGAVTLAALLFGKVDVTGKTVFATISGGNVDAPMMARAFAL